MLWLKIQIRNWKSFLICTTYKPPNVNPNCLDTDFSETLIEALSLNKPVYILGDLNCNMLDGNDPACQSLTKFCSSFNISQLIKQPTRVTENSKTLIDVFLTSTPNLVAETKVIPVSISDHDLVFASLKLKKSVLNLFISMREVINVTTVKPSLKTCLMPHGLSLTALMI